MFSTAGLTPLGGAATNPSTNNAYYWTYSDDLSYSKGRHLLKVGALDRAPAHEQADRDEHPRHLHVPDADALPGGVAQPVRRRAAGRAARTRAAQHAVRVLRAGRLPHDRPPDAESRPALRVLHDAATTRTASTATLRNIFTDNAFTVGGPFAENPSLHNVAPRLGFAWDVHGDGRSRIRGGAGMYHDTDGPFNSSFGISNFSPPFAATTTINNPTFPQPSLTGGTITASARTLDYNIKQPYGITYNVSVQRELRGGLVGMVGYAGSSGRNLITAIEGNPAVPQILADGTKFFPAGAPRRNPAFATSTTGPTAAARVQLAADGGAEALLARLPVAGVVHAGKAMDNTQAQLAADANNSSVYPQDPVQPRRRLGAGGLRRPPRVQAPTSSGNCPAEEPLADRRLAGERHRDRAQRRPVHAGAGRHQLVALGEHLRPGSPEPAARRRSRQPDSRRSESLLRCHRVRPAAGGVARQRGPRTS